MSHPQDPIAPPTPTVSKPLKTISGKATVPASTVKVIPKRALSAKDNVAEISSSSGLCEE